MTYLARGEGLACLVSCDFCLRTTRSAHDLRPKVPPRWRLQDGSHICPKCYRTWSDMLCLQGFSAVRNAR